MIAARRLPLLLALLVFSPASCVTRVELAALEACSADAVAALTSALTGDGIVAISAGEETAGSRRRAFAALHARVEGGDASAMEEKELPDGCVRRTETLTGAAGEDTEQLRGTLRRMSAAVATALDCRLEGRPRALVERGGDGELDSFRDLFAEGESIEHFHHYAPPEGRSAQARKGPALALHRDAGLFLALVPSESNDNFYFLDGNMERRRLEGLRDGDLVFMVGAGAESWLNPVLPEDMQLRALPHGVDRISSPRQWLGRMVLPPRSAVPPGGAVPFGTLRTRALAELGKAGGAAAGALGCGGHEVLEMSNARGTGPWSGARQLRRKEPREGCSAGEFSCWMQCYSAEDLAGLNCGSGGYECVDGNGDVYPSNQSGGHPQCARDANHDPQDPQEAHDGASGSSGFCTGSGVTMFMDGFHWVLGEEGLPCVALFWPQWSLDTTGKYVLACFGVMLLGFFTEILTFLRRRCRRAQLAARGREAAALKFAASALYGFKHLVAFLDMLVAMTYALELLLMVILGFCAGFLACNSWTAVKDGADHCCEGQTDTASESESEEGYHGSYGALGTHEPQHAEVLLAPERQMAFSVEGMTCDGCATEITNACARVGARVRVNVAEKHVTLYNVDRLEQAQRAIEEAGYRVGTV